MDTNQYFSYEEFIVAKNNLKIKIQESKIKYDFLIGNLRGGFYLTDVLSRDLKIPYYLCHISLRDTDNLQGANIFIPKIESYQNYLFIDDMIDSGRTVSYFEKYKNIDYCVLFNSQINTSKRIFSYQNLPENTWIDFFWEKY